MGYTPELLVKSNNDIIFNNDFQSVDVQPHSGNIHLDAKGKIQFNLNVADKATDPTTHQEKLVNDKALVRYYNTITPPPDENDKGSISFHSKTGNLFNMNVNVHKDTHHFGIQNLNNTDVNLTAEDGDNVVAIKGKLADPMPAGKVESTSFLRGIETAFKSNTVLRGNNNKISITTEGGGLGLGVNGLQSNSPYSGHTTGIFINNQSSDLTKPSLDGVSTIELKAVKGNNEVDLNVKHHASVKGIIASHSATATLEAEGDNIVRVKNPDTNTALINAWKEKYPNNSPELYRVGVQSTTDSDVVLNAANNIIEIGGNPMNQAGITAHGNATITLKAKENNKITVENAAYSSDGISTLINRTGARPGKRDDGNKIILEAGGDNIVTMKSGDADADYVNNSDILKGTDSYKYKRGSNGIFAYDDKSLVKLVGENNIVKSEISEKSRALNGGFDHNSIYSWNKAKVELSAKNDNIVQGGTSGLRSSDSSIVLEGKNNAISSLKHNVFAYNKAKVDLTAENKNTLSDAEFGVYALHATSTVNLSSKDKNEVKSTKIGLYSQDGGSINVDGKDNIIEGDKFALIGMNGNLSIHANHENQINSKESGIYAGNTAKIALTGESNTIHASNAAIHSLDKSEVSIDGQITIHSSVANIARRDNSLINLRYKGNSSIDGATVSDGGSVSITPLDNSDDNVMRLTGDVLAVNKGKVELDFTPNSRLVGRLDNFSGLNNPKHKDLFEQYVNLDSKSAGEINLNLAKDALWTMTGQSWMDKLSGEGTVDFDSNSKTSGRALHIGELAGANKFLMHLNKDGIHSDMLYVKKGTSTPQEVVVKNLSEVLDSMNYGDRLRFATVRENSGNEFVNGKKYIDDTHLMEQALTVEYSDHKTDPSNNEDYNRRFNGETMTAEKAGNTDVDAMYGSEHRKNVYLVKQATGNPSRNVKNISDMFDSTAHYAFTLDTYTKREGERAFSTLDKKEGDWIRLTHSRLIQSNAFRFHNNDFEIGYDRFSLNEQEKKRKWGISFDYGHGRTSLWNTFGKGKIRKYELALYNTTQYIDKEGDETGYIDNVLKIGKLRNRVIARNHMGQLWGEGKYSNTLFSISTEYGRRKFLDDDKLWRITPQVQLQYSYLRGAGYRLDNGINVNLSHVNSLIGRLGLDVVRKFDEGKKLFYIKGNILHEFLGSRSFKAFEGNSNYAQKWNTRGTWYSVGLGYNARTGKKTYVFADAEKEFSGGKKGSYNIRLSVSHQFD
ncbi:autotransporter outer membrane beta-barrel domain-containing protein [Neisseria maigaei]|uniref:autotransporter outer membrane beta-barrel domain-containing protein n=1 Tax=Neisseria maigaei TaxID=2830651 RepID=UPI0035711BD8